MNREMTGEITLPLVSRRVRGQLPALAASWLIGVPFAALCMTVALGLWVERLDPAGTRLMLLMAAGLIAPAIVVTWRTVRLRAVAGRSALVPGRAPPSGADGSERPERIRGAARALRRLTEHPHRRAAQELGDVLDRVAVEVLVCAARHVAEMRGQHRVGRGPERMVGRERFGVVDVESRAGDRPGM
jgi:hypothetical protein